MSEKQLDAEAIAEQVYGLAEATRKAVVADVLYELEEARKTGPLASEGDTDTWASGMASAIETIRANF